MPVSFHNIIDNPNIKTPITSNVNSDSGHQSAVKGFSWRGLLQFSSGKSLVAFAGIDPKVKQSGLSLKRNTKITKRGSPHLRYDIYLATMSAQQCDPEFKAYYDKKRSEGKTFKEATLSGSRKMAYRIYAVWKRGTPYIVNP